MYKAYFIYELCFFAFVQTHATCDSDIFAVIICDRNVWHVAIMSHVAWGGVWVEMWWNKSEIRKKVNNIWFYINCWYNLSISFISLFGCHMNYTFHRCNDVIITSVKLVISPIFIVKQSNISVNYTMSLWFDATSGQLLLIEFMCIPLPVQILFAASFIVACVWTFFVIVAHHKSRVACHKSHVCEHRLTKNKYLEW